MLYTTNTMTHAIQDESSGVEFSRREMVFFCKQRIPNWHNYQWRQQSYELASWDNSRFDTLRVMTSAGVAVALFISIIVVPLEKERKKSEEKYRRLRAEFSVDFN